MNLSLPETAALSAFARKARHLVGEIAEEAVGEIERAVPDFVRPHDPRYAKAVRLTVERSIEHFLDLLADPGASADELTALFRKIGAGEALEGRNLRGWQISLHIGARVAIRRLTEEAALLRVDLPTELLGEVTAAVFAYLDELAIAAGLGYDETSAGEQSALAARRRRLLEALVQEPQPALPALRELAQLARWQLPVTVAAVALHPGEASGPLGRTLPEEILLGLHLDQPCLIVPDPEGPGRRRLLETGLHGWTAAMGPAVDPGEVGVSLCWARRTLAVARRGLIPAIAGEGLVKATEHLPTVLIMQGEDLAEQVAIRRLAPLQNVQPGYRRRLAETLRACFECDFGTLEVARRLGVHPQTIRYRLRHLADLFGDTIHDPALRLEFQIVLEVWLASDAGNS